MPVPDPTRQKLSHLSLQQAAHWYVLLNEQTPSAQTHQQWQQWLEQHGDHQAAWRYVERVGQRFDSLQAPGERTAASQLLRGRAGLSRRQGVKSLLVVCGGSLLAWGSWRTTALPRVLGAWTADYATGTGETRQALLADGSQLWLNALSAVDADFSPTLRLLRLRFGEVLIDTAKDPARPFVVETAQGRLQALGTRFSVQDREHGTRLNVFEGAVQVRTADSGQTLVVQAGQQLDFTRASLAQARLAQAARESWTRHMLLADNMPLQQVVEELGRFRPGHLGCDPALGALPVMGSFPLHDTDQALRLLEAALPLRIQRLTPWWVTLEPKASPA